MVGLHVVYHQIIHLSVADDLVNMFDKLCEEVNLYGIYKAHLLIVDEV